MTGVCCGILQVFVCLADLKLEVASRCGVKPFTYVMHESTLRLYGHVVRWQGGREGDGVLGKVMATEVYGTSRKRRSKMTWMNNMEKLISHWNLLE